MDTNELIKEIKKLPLSKRIYVIEKAVHSLKEYENENRLLSAVEELYEDYKNDEELTSFTGIDSDDFYETK